MKRIRVMLGFLLLGAIVNVAVAWGSVLFFDVFNGRYDDLTFGDHRGKIHLIRYDHFASSFVMAIPQRRSVRTMTPLWWSKELEFGPPDHLSDGDNPRYCEPSQFIPGWAKRDLTSQIGAVALDNRLHAVATEGRGWPMTCLSRRFIVSQPIPGLVRVFISADPAVDLPIPLPDRLRFAGATYPVGLPVTAYWPAFIFNTVIFALLLWLSVVSHRIHRLVRNRCITCGYDLKGSDHDVCPECGSVIAKVKPT